MTRRESAIISLLLLMPVFGCASLYVYPGGNRPEDRGLCPVNYEQIIRKYLKKALYDPYSVRDLTISMPEAESCLIGGRSLFHGWRVDVSYNAKNRLGGYVGLKTYYYWFCGERLSAITEDFYYCRDIYRSMAK